MSPRACRKDEVSTLLDMSLRQRLWVALPWGLRMRGLLVGDMSQGQGPVGTVAAHCKGSLPWRVPGAGTSWKRLCGVGGRVPWGPPQESEEQAGLHHGLRVEGQSAGHLQALPGLLVTDGLLC